MRKKLFFVLSFLLVTYGCTSFSMDSSDGSAVKSQNNLINVNKNTGNNSNTVHNKTDSNPQISIFDVNLSPAKNNQKEDFVIEIGRITGWLEIKKGTEFDIMNEYGFLAKGKFTEYIEPTKENDGYWKAEILKESLRPNLKELSYTRMSEREKESPSIPAIGIFPSNPERQKIRSGDKIDMSEKSVSDRQKIYLLLPEEIRNNADVYGEKGSLEYPNGWADLDGDGKIDYIYIRVRCDENPNSHCSKNLYLYEDKWIEIPEQIEKTR